MADWTPPANGVFCWVEIPAQDVQRAKQFYATAFSWPFKSHSSTTKSYPEDKFAFFEMPGPKSLPISGGIVHVPEDSHIGGTGAVKLYIWVDDLEETMDKIVKAGGKKQSEVEPESDFGLMMAFDDTEGNRFGIYTAAPKKE